MKNLWVYIIVFGSITIGTVISALWKFRKAKQANKYWEDLKKGGSPIRVLLKDVEIKTNEYYETPVRDSMPSRMEMLDGLSGSDRPDGKIKRVVSVLIYKYKNQIGNVITFQSEMIEMPIENLILKMENKAETTVYVDENNWNKYYFDIEFLED